MASLRRGHRQRLRRPGLPRRRPAAAGRRQPGRADLGGGRLRRAAGRVRLGPLDRLGHRLPGDGRPATTATSGRCRSCRPSPASPRPSATGRSSRCPSRSPSCRPTRRASSAASSRPSSSSRRRPCCAARSTPAGRPTSCGRGSPRRQRPPARYGHGAIYTQKAFQLLDRLGWERADTGAAAPRADDRRTAPARTRCRTCGRSRGRSPPSTSSALAAIEPDPSWRGRRRACAPRSSAVGPTARRRSAAVAALRDGRRHRRRARRRRRRGRRAHAALRPGGRVRLPRRLRLARHHPRPHLRQRRALARRHAAESRPTPCAWRCGACSSPTGPVATSGTPTSVARRRGRPRHDRRRRRRRGAAAPGAR